MNPKISIGIFVFTQELGHLADFKAQVARIMTAIGCQKLEPVFPLENPDGLPKLDFARREIDQWAEIAKKHNLLFPSMAFNFAFYKGLTAKYADTVEQIVAYAAEVFKDTNLFVCNPIPLSWTDSSRQKTSQQLSLQLRDIKHLSAIFKQYGKQLSYHFHSPELYNNAHELHYMLGHTTTRDLSLTLDTNWCVMGDYAYQKILKQYGSRLDNIHLRSSREKVWEAFLTEGDEQHSQFMKDVQKLDYNGHYVIELGNPQGISFDIPLAERLEKSIDAFNQWQ